MRRIVLLSLFTAIALVLSLVDSALPPLLPVPGVRLGLANVVTLILLFTVRPRDAFLVLILRIILSSIFAGQGMSFLYSLAGGLLCSCDVSAQPLIPPFLCDSRQHMRRSLP